MFGQILKQWFWDTYDQAIRLLVINLALFFALAFAGVALVAVFLPGGGEGASQLIPGLLGTAVGIPVLGTIWFAGLMHFCRASTAERGATFRSFLEGYRRFAGRFVLFFLIAGLITALLLLNIWFYFLSGFMKDGLRYAGYFLGGLMVWLLLFLAGVLVHGMPWLVRGSVNPRSALRRGLYLTVKYPVLTITVVLFIASILILGAAVKLLGIVFICLSAGATLINSTHDVIMETEWRSGSSATEPLTKQRPASWTEMRRTEEESERRRLRRRRYDRSLRDILKPWDYQ